MSVTKEIIENEALRLASGERNVIHLHREGSFFVPMSGVHSSHADTYIPSRLTNRRLKVLTNPWHT